MMKNDYLRVQGKHGEDWGGKFRKNDENGWLRVGEDVVNIGEEEQS